MVNKLSNLAEFLQDDALPYQLTKTLKDSEQEIATKLTRGESVSIAGPRGETITITPKAGIDRR
jgi:hypothetical protein